VIFDDMIAVSDAHPHDAPLNMAIDETLLRAAIRPTLRIYRWARPALSFGYFGKWSEAAAAGAGREIVRRWTGGGIVPHGEDLTFSLIVPRGHPFFAVSPRETYCAIHECVAQALGNASLAAAPGPPVSASCFANPVLHDVLIAERKVAGGAQRRTKCGMLHQGSIQGVDDLTAVADALVRRLSRQNSAENLSDRVRGDAEILSREKYATDEWTRRVP
jgi:lipoyl(octanoyl) transferase